MANTEHNWDKLLQIQTCGRDETNADEYHHPYEPTPYSVLERLEDVGAVIHRTDREGTLVVTIREGQIAVKSENTK